jgi:ABC-2 type transport system ATP-binding protein
MSASIEIDHLRLNYGNVTALDDLTLTLPGGRIYGLLGRTGSGKTSLLSVLAAFRKATSGTVRVQGQPVFENSRITSQICLIREAGDTVDKSDPVEDALKLAEHMRPRWDTDYAASLVDLFQLPMRTHIGDLSRGQRSLLGIILGLASRAPLTMFDESHLGMDSPSRYAFYDALLADFMAHPRTIIISTHLIEEVASLLEQVAIIDKGRLVLFEETESLRARGVTVTGPADAVDDFVAGLTVLDEKSLGRTKLAMVYGILDDRLLTQAHNTGLDLGPIALQDLFIHLTQPAGELT